MLLSQLLVVALGVAPSLVSAAIFPPDSLVKMIDAKGFKKAMRVNRTSVVAFVAPWCGHCQRMVPEYSKAALGLHPLIPLYAVDCDNDNNKQLCAEQGVQGFPTVKLFPRGKQHTPITYDSGERTATAFYYWASRRVPNKNKKLYHAEDIPSWVTENIDKPRALLLTKDKKVPLLWQVLGNKYQDEITLGSHRDKGGKTSVALGFEPGEKKQAKVLIYPIGSETPVLYEGINKLDSLNKFFRSVANGTADLQVVNEEAKAEEFVQDEKDIEIEQMQEAQRIALAHGGYTEFIDFKKAIKEGHGADYHDVHGYHGKTGSSPSQSEETHASAAGGETEKASSEKGGSAATTDETAQAVFEAVTERETPDGSQSAAASEATLAKSHSEEEHVKDEL